MHNQKPSKQTNGNGKTSNKNGAEVVSVLVMQLHMHLMDTLWGGDSWLRSPDLNSISILKPTTFHITECVLCELLQTNIPELFMLNLLYGFAVHHCLHSCGFACVAHSAEGHPKYYSGNILILVL